ncbi:hypothetical protein D3C84_843440 [compost metagenome]
MLLVLERSLPGLSVVPYGIIFILKRLFRRRIATVYLHEFVDQHPDGSPVRDNMMHVHQQVRFSLADRRQFGPQQRSLTQIERDDKPLNRRSQFRAAVQR